MYIYICKCIYTERILDVIGLSGIRMVHKFCFGSLVSQGVFVLYAGFKETVARCCFHLVDNADEGSACGVKQ